MIQWSWFFFVLLRRGWFDRARDTAVFECRGTLTWLSPLAVEYLLEMSLLRRARKDGVFMSCYCCRPTLPTRLALYCNSSPEVEHWSTGRINHAVLDLHRAVVPPNTSQLQQHRNAISYDTTIIWCKTRWRPWDPQCLRSTGLSTCIYPKRPRRPLHKNVPYRHGGLHSRLYLPCELSGP